MTTDRPFRDFTERLAQFAAGRRGARNPFVVVPVQPASERRVAEALVAWADDPDRTGGFPNDGTVQHLRLDELSAETDAFELLTDLGGAVSPAVLEETLRDRLAEELVAELLDGDVLDDAHRRSHVVLLTHFGSLSPFTRASELLDELDRRDVRSTIGIPVPSDVVTGDPRAHCPAHRVDGRIEEVHLR